MVLEVKVNRLNKRRAIPFAFPDSVNIIGEVFRGYTFIGEEVPLSEIPNPALGKWYKDRDGIFYWGEGVSVLPDEIISIESEFPKWMTDLKIPEIWSIATGKNIGIAVIDTGIDLHNPDLVIENKFFLFNGGTSIQDTKGHGTHCAGLAGAKNQHGKKIGIAFNSKIFVCKISDQNSLKEEETIRYADAINWCADQEEINIISISWGSFIDNPGTISEIQKAINHAVNKNKVVVCAMGDASQLNDPGPIYPVSLGNTIGIGSIPVKDALYPFMNDSLTTCMNGMDIISFGFSNQTVALSGTSQSNAIIAGIIGLMIEKNHFIYSPEQIRKTLLLLSTFQVFDTVKIPVLNGELLLKYFQT